MRSSPGFVGRAEDRTRLRRLLLDPEHPRTVISGPYGIGKTRLVQEVLAERDDRRVAWLAAETGAGPASRSEAPTRSRPVVGILEVERAELDVLVVDEVVPVDDQRARWLWSVADHRGMQVIEIHCTHLARTGPTGGAPLDRPAFRLTPLTAEEVAALAHATLGAPLGTHALSDLVERCGGHPRFVEELLAHARSRGILREDADGVFRLHGVLEVPALLASDLGDRLIGLAPVASEVLDLVAIAGRIPLRAILDVAPPAVCRELERRGLVTIDHQAATILCAHPVLAAAVLAGHGPATRHRRHQQLVTLLRERPGTDPVGLARWSRSTGTPAEPDLLIVGARVAAARLDFAVAAELSAPSGVAASADTVASAPNVDSLLASLGSVEVGTWSDAARTHDACFSDLTSGRLQDAEAPLTETIEELQGAPYPKARLLELQLEFVRHHVRVTRGALDEARGDAEAARSRALVDRDRVAAGMFAANLGHVARFQGDLRTAEGALTDAEHELAALDPLRLGAQLAGHRAIVAAELGRRTEVATLLERVDTGPGPAPVPREVLQHRVRGWLAALDRDEPAAEHHFRAAVRAATQGQQPLLAVFAAHSAVRLGYAAEFLDDLQAATVGVEGELAPALVAHARAAAIGDAAQLTAAAYRFAELGARLWAAEAFVTAAQVHADHDAPGGRRCRALAGFVRPDGAVGGWILGSEADAPGLGAREREVARFAGEGWRTHRIAAALGLSPRTVETQLRAVFRKLGVTRRDQIPVSRPL